LQKLLQAFVHLVNSLIQQWVLSLVGSTTWCSILLSTKISIVLFPPLIKRIEKRVVGELLTSLVPHIIDLCFLRTSRNLAVSIIMVSSTKITCKIGWAETDATCMACIYWGNFAIYWLSTSIWDRSLCWAKRASCEFKSNNPLFCARVFPCWIQKLVKEMDSIMAMASCTVLNKIEPPKEASRIVFDCGWSQLQNFYTCIFTSNLWLGHFLNKTLNISQASHNGSSTPYTNVDTVAFASVFLDDRKKRAKNMVSISF